MSICTRLLIKSMNSCFYFHDYSIFFLLMLKFTHLYPILNNFKCVGLINFFCEFYIQEIMIRANTTLHELLTSYIKKKGMSWSYSLTHSLNHTLNYWATSSIFCNSLPGNKLSMLSDFNPFFYYHC